MIFRHLIYNIFKPHDGRGKGKGGAGAAWPGGAGEALETRARAPVSDTILPLWHNGYYQ